MGYWSKPEIAVSRRALSSCVTAAPTPIASTCEPWALTRSASAAARRSAVASPSVRPVTVPVGVLWAVGSPSVMKMTMSAFGPPGLALACFTTWKAASQFVQPPGT